MSSLSEESVSDSDPEHEAPISIGNDGTVSWPRHREGALLHGVDIPLEDAKLLANNSRAIEKAFRFYMFQIDQTRQLRQLLATYDQWRGDLGNVGFGPFTLGLALFDAKTMLEQSLQRQEALEAAEKFIHTLQTTNLLSLDMASVRRNFENFAELLGASEIFENDVEAIETAMRDGNLEGAQKIVKAIRVALVQKKVLLGEIRISEPLSPGVNWETAFQRVTGMTLSAFNTLATVLQSRDPAAFEAVTAECTVYVNAILGTHEKLPVYDDHYVDPSRRAFGNVDEVPEDFARVINVDYDFQSAGLQERFQLSWVRGFIRDEDKKHFLYLLGRIWYRARMVVKIKQLIEEDAAYSRVGTEVAQWPLNSVVAAICQGYDTLVHKNILDLEFLGIDPTAVSRIVSNMVAETISDIKEAENDDDDYDDSGEAIDKEDGGDKDSADNGGDFDDYFADDDSFVENDDLDFIEERKRKREVMEKQKKAAELVKAAKLVQTVPKPGEGEVMEIQKKAEELAQTVPKPGEGEEEDYDDDEDDEGFDQARMLTINQTTQFSRPWSNFFRCMELDGRDLGAIYGDLSYSVMPGAQFPGEGIISPTTYLFLKEYGPVFFALDDNETDLAFQKLMSYFNADQDDNDGLIFEESRDTFLAATVQSGDFSRFLAELWAFVSLVEEEGNYHWQTNECQADAAYHVYRIFHLEYFCGLFALKFQNGKPVSDFEPLVRDFLLHGYPRLSAEDNTKRQEYADNTEAWIENKKMLAHMPGLSLVDQYWHLLPTEQRQWFAGAAAYLARLDPAKFGANVAWWYDKRARKGAATQWKHGRELFHLFLETFDREDTDAVDSIYSRFFATALAQMAKTIDYMNSCPWKREIMKISRSGHYCVHAEHKVTSMIRRVVELAVIPGEDDDRNQRFVRKFSKLIDTFDCPATLLDAVKHYDGEETAAHNNATEFDAGSNVLVALAYAMGFYDMQYQDASDNRGMKRALERGKDDPNEESQKQRPKFFKPFLFRKFASILNC
jgi:hypothetical protein